MGENVASPGTAFHRVFGEALGFSTPGSRRRNKKLHALTPEGTHLDAESQAWLQRHQEKAHARLERRVVSKLAVQLKRHPPPKESTAGDTEFASGYAPSFASASSKTGSFSSSSSSSSWAPQRLLRPSAPRMPPKAERGTEPQVLLFELDVLVLRYRESLWDKEDLTAARPGLVEAFLRLRERFLLCAVARSPVPAALDLLAMLVDRGLTFDFAVALPPPEGSPGSIKGHAAGADRCPVLDAEGMRVLREEMGMTIASMERRLLAIVGVELDDEELDARLPSPTDTALSPQSIPAAAAARNTPMWLQYGKAEPRRSATAAATPSTNTAAAESATATATSETNTPPAASTRSHTDLLSTANGPPRPHVRLWLPGVTTLLVPHPRLQDAEASVHSALLADLVLHVHRLGPRDWTAAHAAQDTGLPGGGRVGTSVHLASPASARGAGSSRSSLLHGASSFRSPSHRSPLWRRRGGESSFGSARSYAVNREGGSVGTPGPALVEACYLSGVPRILLSSEEVSRCGLAPPPPATVHRQGGEQRPASAIGSHTESSSDGAVEARLFVLCVRRMQRVRREGSKALNASDGSLMSSSSTSRLAQVGCSKIRTVSVAPPAPLSPSTSIQSNGGGGLRSPQSQWRPADLCTDVGATDPLGVAPFEVWATVNAMSPPGAPKQSMLPRPALKKGKGSRRSTKA